MATFRAKMKELFAIHVIMNEIHVLTSYMTIN